MYRSAIAMLKLEVGCARCGFDEDPAALDFDHVRGVKTANIATLAGTSRSLTLLLDEVEKCQVLCANCHRITTARRREA
jgi:hypothetical protein